MCIHNLVKLCPLVLKILSGNEMVTELRNGGIMVGQGKSSIAPLFRALKNKTCNTIMSSGSLVYMSINFEPRFEKTGLRGFRPGLTQTGLYSHRRWLEA